MDRREFFRYALAWGAGMGATPKEFVPGYRQLEKQGKLTARINDLYAIYENCTLCPRECGVNRLKGEKGVCRSTTRLKVASAYPHIGEEDPLVGKKGSGTIFFSQCNLRCVFCINYHVNHLGGGQEVSEAKLAELMLRLQKRGCKNINLVTPSHYVPNIVKAVQLACRKGLTIPLTYNTSSYDHPRTLELLKGIVDIYLPDLKYMESKHSKRYSAGAADYPKIATANILEMHNQVGVLKKDSQGNAQRGVILRHLVMPNNVSDTDQVVQWIAQNLPKNTYVNIMGQYRPEYKAKQYPKISRPITKQEFKQALQWAREAGLTNLDRDSLYWLRRLS